MGKYFPIIQKINAKGGVKKERKSDGKKINATYKKEQKLFKQQEQIYLNLTKIQETDVEGYSSYCDHHP